MFKRIGVYIILAIIFVLNLGHFRFSAPFIFEDWQTVQFVWAAKNGNTDKMDELIAAGVDVNTPGKYTFTPLSWVLINVKPSEKKAIGFKHLLINGADTSTPLAFHLDSLLHVVAKLQEPEYLKLMVEHGHDLRIDDDRFNRTPLIKTIYRRNYNNFITLLEAGANFESTTKNRSALEIAAGTSSWKFALELLKRGADYNYKSTYRFNELRDIQLSLENSRYWPSAVTSDGGVDYREKVIEFLRAEGVEVYPWYPEDDPRHNPRPEPQQITIYTPYSRETRESYDLFYRNKILKKVTVTSSLIFGSETITAEAIVLYSEDSPQIVSTALLSEQTLIDFETNAVIKAEEVQNPALNQIGVVIDDIKVPLDFVFRNQSPTEIYDQFKNYDQAVEFRNES